jgi:hypothetical protein
LKTGSSAPGSIEEYVEVLNLSMYKEYMSKDRYNHFYKIFHEDIKHRDNLKDSHLAQLEILCRICVECEQLEELVSDMGWTYTSQGRNGYQEKIRPEVQQLNKNRGEIRAYSKMLGICLVKDSKSDEPEDDDFS